MPELPTDHPRPAVQSHRGGSETINPGIGPGSMERWKQFVTEVKR